MRLWAVNTEKAEEKNPLVGAIMVRDNTHRAVVSPKAQQCTHNGGRGRHRSSMTSESILGYTHTVCLWKRQRCSVVAVTHGSFSPSHREAQQQPAASHRSQRCLSVRPADGMPNGVTTDSAQDTQTADSLLPRSIFPRMNL